MLRPTVMPGLDHVAAIAVADWDVCARRDDGSVACEEFGARAPSVIAALDHVAEIAAERSLTCARHGGKVACWSIDVGHEVFVRAAPHDIAGITDAVQIAVTGFTACARRASGEVACWTESAPNAGDADPKPAFDGSPKPVAGATGAIQIAGGGLRFAALLPGGKTFGWDDHAKPWALPVGNVTRLALGGSAICVVAGAVTCVDDKVTTEMPALAGAAEIVVDSSDGCARMPDGHVRCWGYVDRLGIGEPFARRMPVEVAGIDDAVELAGTGSPSTCARRKTGRVSCWGHKLLGKLAADDEANHDDRAPVDVGLDHVTELDVGYTTACARLADGNLMCWGDHDNGKRRWETPTRVTRRPDGVSHGPINTWGGGWQRQSWSCTRRGKGVSCTEHFSGRHEGTDSGDWHDQTYDSLTDVADLLIPLDGTDAPFVLHPNGTVEMEDRGTWTHVMDDVAELVHAAPDEHGNPNICARLRTGAVTCWQGSSFDNRTDMGITDAVQLVGTHDGLGGRGCALRKSGHVSCWGDRDSVGDGHGMIVGPTEVPGLVL